MNNTLFISKEILNYDVKCDLKYNYIEIGKYGINDYTIEDLNYNVKKDKDCFIIEIDICGFKNEEVKVDLIGSYLIIKCEKSIKENYLIKNIKDKINITFKIENIVDFENIDLYYNYGILRIYLPLKDVRKKFFIRGFNNEI